MGKNSRGISPGAMQGIAGDAFLRTGKSARGLPEGLRKPGIVSIPGDGWVGSVRQGWDPADMLNPNLLSRALQNGQKRLPICKFPIISKLSCWGCCSPITGKRKRLPLPMVMQQQPQMLSWIQCKLS